MAPIGICVMCILTPVAVGVPVVVAKDVVARDADCMSSLVSEVEVVGHAPCTIHHNYAKCDLAASRTDVAQLGAQTVEGSVGYPSFVHMVQLLLQVIGYPQLPDKRTEVFS